MPVNANIHLTIALTAVGLGFLLSTAPGGRADGPDYEGTIAYIQSGLSGTFTELDQCTFHSKNPPPEGEHIFHAGALGVVPTAITPDEIGFACPEGVHCVSALSENPTDKNEIRFAIHNDAHGVALAVSRLIEMCSGVLH